MARDPQVTTKALEIAWEMTKMAFAGRLPPGDPRSLVRVIQDIFSDSFSTIESHLDADDD